MTTLNYYAYITSDEWRNKAEKAKARAGYRCQICNAHQSDVMLHAHHRTYERLGNERPDDITVLCEECHGKFHDKPKHKSSFFGSAKKAFRAGRRVFIPPDMTKRGSK